MLFQEVQNMMDKDNIQPECFKDRIIFMSMYSDIDWGSPKDIGHASDQKNNGMVRSPTNQTVLGTESLSK